MVNKTYNPDSYQRRSIRLKDYDYSQPGAYFITITTYQRASLFGEIKDQTMQLNPYGLIVQSCWDSIPSHYSNIVLDSFVIMPNHVHGIIAIEARAGLKPAPTKNPPLPEIVRAFKTFSSKQINSVRGMPGLPVWQRNYYEHIVRNELELSSIKEYIGNNVAQWELDNENPEFDIEKGLA